MMIDTVVDLLHTLKAEGWPLWAIVGTIIWYVLFKGMSKLGLLAKTFAESMRDHYGKIMEDLERTNTRLRSERDDAEKRLAKSAAAVEELQKTVTALTQTLNGKH